MIHDLPSLERGRFEKVKEEQVHEYHAVQNKDTQTEENTSAGPIMTETKDQTEPKKEKAVSSISGFARHMKLLSHRR
jgi:hypothetical protein